MQKEKINVSHKKGFMDGFKSLCATRHPYSVWSDFWRIAALTIINTLTKESYTQYDRLANLWREREDEYLGIVNKYQKDEIKTIIEMFSLVVMEFEREPYQDFAGQCYMELGISNSNAGQFFTPYTVCQTMARITTDHEHLRQLVREHGWYTAYDCACGGGATMIAAAEIADIEFNRLDYRNHLLIVANDIDVVCASMCYVQLSLLGVAAIVTCSNTLMQDGVDFYKEPEKVYFTPMYLSDVWAKRRFFHGYNLNMQKDYNCGINILNPNPESVW